MTKDGMSNESNESPKDLPRDDQVADGSDQEGLSNAQAAEQEQDRQEQTGQESPV